MKTAKARLLCDMSFLAALLAKVFATGVTYYPVLDDYIQYGGYPLYDSLSHVYLNIGTIATRPAASLLDPAWWGQMYPHLWVTLLCISALFFMGTKLLCTSLERIDIHVTPFLYAILLLCPLGFEGTYWISASSRICVGIFFAALSLWLLIKFIDTKVRTYFPFYALCTLLSYGFYESVMVLSALLQLIFILRLVRENKKRALYLITPVVLGVLMLVYYKLAQNIGAMGSRASGFDFANLFSNAAELISQFFEIMVAGGGLTVVMGTAWGIKLLISSVWGIGIFALIILIAIACGYFGAKQSFFADWRICLPAGLALTILPLIPNALSSPVWLTYRSVVVCFIGLAIISACIIKKLLNKSVVRGIAIFLMVLVFSFANVNELDTYRRVWETDDALVTEICQQIDTDKEAIVVLTEEVIVPQVSYYKDHVKSVFDSDWALTGAVRAKLRNINTKMITPVLSLDGVDTEEKQIIYIGGNNGK